MTVEDRRDEPMFTVAEAAARSGLTAEEVLEINRASGFADPDPHLKVFVASDIEILDGFVAARDFFGHELMLQITRLMGNAMKRVADGFVSILAVNLGEQRRQRSLDEAAFAEANSIANAMIPDAINAMAVILRRHIDMRSRFELPPEDEWEGVDALHRAVGFCDLVGFTALTDGLTRPAIAELVASFEGRASAVITQHGGDVIKHIGDEVMFVAPDASTAARVALALTEAFGGDMPEVRVGLAEGRVILQEGDYYGPVVNLAARLVKVAEPRSVAAPSAFGEDLPRVTAGPRALKGFEEPIDVIRLLPT